jgi:cytochrome c peroxidase
MSLVLNACGEGTGLTEAERSLAVSMQLPQKMEVKDPSNAYVGNQDAFALGKKLFFDTRFSVNGKVSCASCHQPENQFQDGLPLAVALGTNTRRTMPLAGAAQSRWYFWDGRADSLWSQALGPLENPFEHAMDRTTVAKIFLKNYVDEYQRVFGPKPDVGATPEQGASPLGSDSQKSKWSKLQPMQQESINRVFANLGKAIAAYETTLVFEQTKFDMAMAGKGEILSVQEELGLKIFLGKGNCITCHTGPRFTDDHFHNTAVPEVPGLPHDMGRAAVLKIVRQDPFNCLGAYSDADKKDCRELRFMATDDHVMERAYKTPTLRGVATRAPYMHAGQFETLEQVVDHYSAAPSPPHGESELRSLALSAKEKSALVSFLRTLN